MEELRLEDQSPAIRALGPLFRLTQLCLWDDDGKANGSPGEVVNVSNSVADAKHNVEATLEDPIFTEDLDLVDAMDALGLPISFSTTKQMKRYSTKRKGKGMQPKHNYVDNVLQDAVPGFAELPKCENARLTKICHDIPSFDTCSNQTGSPATSIDNSRKKDSGIGCHDDEHSRFEDTAVPNLVGESGHCKTVHVMGGDEPWELPQNSDAGSSSGYSSFANNDGEVLGILPSSKHLNVAPIDALHQSDNAGSETSQTCQSCMEMGCSCASSAQHVGDCPDANNSWEFGEWKVVWDDYYSRCYFYNSATEESTWSPPTGLEHFAFSYEHASDECTSETVNDHSNISFCDAIQNHVANSHFIFNSCHEMNDNAAYNHELMPDDDSERKNCASSVTEDLASMSDSEKVSGEVHPSRYNVPTPSDEMDVEEQFDKEETENQDLLGVKNLAEQVPMKKCLRSISNGFDAEGDAPVIIHELDVAPQKVAKKRKNRKQKFQSEIGLQGEVGDVSPNLMKYWCQRYSLFSQFDNGIKMDEEGWFSVTPESIARHHANRCGNGTVIDCFTGVGGNAIQFAMRSNHVVAIDIDPKKIELARHNAAIYGVSDKIDFIVGDFFRIASHLKADTVFLSPPWGGPDYAKAKVYDIKSMLKPLDGYHLFKIATMISPFVVIFLPKNVDMNQLADISLSVSPPWKVEVEKNVLNGKLKATTAYFSKASEIKCG